MLSPTITLLCLLAGRPCAAAAAPAVPPAAWEEPADGEATASAGITDTGTPTRTLVAREELAQVALGYLGTAYRLGGRDPRTGVDCASFVRLVFAGHGIELPYTAVAQIAHGAAVDRDELLAGDLVFFRDTYKLGISHVGIYLGDGRFVHAASRRHGVVVTDLATPYWQRRFAGGRRLLPVASSDTLAAAAAEPVDGSTAR